MTTVNINRDPSSLLDRIFFRSVQPTDIPRCHQIEHASYPEDEAASKSSLQYRQHHAAPFFRCAFLIGDHVNPGSGSPGGQTSTSSSISYQGQSVNLGATLRGTIIGFICSTRCKSYTTEAMKVHDGTGKILAIHSVVVEEKFRNCGVGGAMLQDYISHMDRLNNKGDLRVRMEKICLISKKHLLPFYLKNGFTAIGVSSVVHGKDQWFDFERNFVLSQPSNGKNNENCHDCFIVDSFADEKKQGTGNPAGVVLLSGPPGAMNESTESNFSSKASKRGVEWMATVAKEFSLSETAFVWPLPKKSAPINECCCPRQKVIQPPVYAIQYYTKAGVEVDLCGHATLAAACVLFKKTKHPEQANKITFVANNDDLDVELLTRPNYQSTASVSAISNNETRVAMNLPWKNLTPVSSETDVWKEVLNMISRAFSGSNTSVESSRQFLTQYVLHIGTTDKDEDLLIEMTEEGFDLLKGVNRIDYCALSVWQGYSRGVIICCSVSTPKEKTAQQTSIKSDFKSRFFAPKVGIDEDQVTGSAHCALGPYFGKKLGKEKVIGLQCSDRGGLVECTLKPDEGLVCIVGTAVVTVTGQLSISI